MLKYCKGVVALPWEAANDSFTDAIEESDALPTTITQLTRYFNGSRAPGPGVGRQFAKNCLGFPIRTDRPTFEADIQGWLNSKNIRMYSCAVHHSNVKTIG